MMKKNPIIISSPPVPFLIPMNFKKLLSEILKNRKIMEENFKHQPHTDMLSVQGTLSNLVNIFHKIYYQDDNGKYFVETSTFPLLKNELPDEIRKILDSIELGEEFDVTEFIKSELDNFKEM